MDIVLMGVPRHMAQAVADLIASEADVDGTATSARALLNGWTEEKLRRAYRESGENMRSLLRHLAHHPDAEFGTEEIAKALGLPGWNSVAAMLGPFTRRYRGRYRVALPPWTQRTDASNRDHLRMPAEVAEILREEARRDAK
ncbi:MAG TPA: hypothetical protein VFG31_08975 [Conexibacter sp.]|nr:hypothetical protein [Conexibacter sp.]